MRLAEENAVGKHSHICPICRVGVYLCVNRTDQGKRFYFKHRVEDGNCPAITRSQFSKEEIEARKYNGVKESAAHRRMKELVAESLAKDPNVTDIEIEAVWKGDGGTWRKPDVRATIGGTKVVFEIQLSTTFLHVIAERRLFYRQHGSILCWIFKSFDPTDARMTQDDIFYNNNRNLFIVSEQTLADSRENKTFMLDCHWQEPDVVDGRVIDRWNGKTVKFSELMHDFGEQRVYYYDYDLYRGDAEVDARREGILRRFEQWWADNSFPQADCAWTGFRKEFQPYGIQLPQYPNELSGLLKALYSAKAGKAVGWAHPKFISVAHTIAGSHPQALQPFLAAISVYGRGAQLKNEDSPKPGDVKGKWEKKLENCRDLKANGDTRFNRDRNYDTLVGFLFPEVMAKLRDWDTIASE